MAAFGTRDNDKIINRCPLERYFEARNGDSRDTRCAYAVYRVDIGFEAFFHRVFLKVVRFSPDEKDLECEFFRFREIYRDWITGIS